LGAFSMQQTQEFYVTSLTECILDVYISHTTTANLWWNLSPTYMPYIANIPSSCLQAHSHGHYCRV